MSVQPRARLASTRRSIGERATKAMAIRWRTSAILRGEGAHEGGAHRAGRLALRPEHVAVDGEGVLVAEEGGEGGLAVLAGEAVVLGDLAAGRELAAELGDALGGAADLDLLGEKRVAGGAVFGALVREVRGVPRGERLGGHELVLVGHRCASLRRFLLCSYVDINIMPACQNRFPRLQRTRPRWRSATIACACTRSGRRGRWRGGSTRRSGRWG